MVSHLKSSADTTVKLIAAILFLSGIFMSHPALSQQKSSDNTPVKFEKRQIKLTHKKNSKTFTVEFAETDAQKNHGLMFRQSLKGDEGMLFVFAEQRTLSFWMKNTFVDLDIGFFNNKKVLVDIQQMAATSTMQQSFPNYISKSPAQYALEMPQGWFSRNKFPIGTKLEIPKR